MKAYKIIACASLAALLAACGPKGTTTNLNSSPEETSAEEETEIQTETQPERQTEEAAFSDEAVTAEDVYSGEAGVEFELPGGKWEVTLNNKKSTRLEQGDKTITASIIDDPDFEAADLPQSREDVASQFSSTDAPADVLDFNLTDNEDGTFIINYTVKYKTQTGIATLVTCTTVLSEHKAVAVDGIIHSDADDAEIEMIKTAVNAAITDKIKDSED